MLFTIIITYTVESNCKYNNKNDCKNNWNDEINVRKVSTCISRDNYQSSIGNFSLLQNRINIDLIRMYIKLMLLTVACLSEPFDDVKPSLTLPSAKATKL